MDSSQPDPVLELAALSRAARGLADLDRLLGVAVSPTPERGPVRALRAQAPPPTQQAQRSRPDPDFELPRTLRGSRGAPAPKPAPASERSPSPAARAPQRSPHSAPARPEAPPRSGPAPLSAPSAPPSPALAQRRAEAEGRLHALANRMAGCQRCQLAAGRTKLVFGQGDAAAELVFVGEGPGYHEDMQGQAFVGPSGQLLTKMINGMGYLRREVFICNVVKCRPPRNRNPQPDEMGTCLPFLREQLEIIRPRAICALGKTAALGLGLIAPDASLGRSRGQVLKWEGVPVVLTYHPAYLLRSPEQKPNAWRDLQLLFPLLERRRPGPIRPGEAEGT